MSWLGLLLIVIAFLSYPFFFVRFPVTRDVPWANYLLFALALLLLWVGYRRATRKRLALIVGIIGLAICLLFVGGINFGSRLPAVTNAPRVGQPVPQFTLLDTNRRTVSLQQLLAASPHGVVLVFYRGHW